MPQCAKCKNWFDPGFTVPAEDNDNLCVFCVRDVDKVSIKGNNGTTTITKNEVIEAYRRFIKDVVDKNEKLTEKAKNGGSIIK